MRWTRSERSLGLILGFLADRVLGDPLRGHPVAGFGAVAAGLERAVWRPSRVVGAGYAATMVGTVLVGVGAVGHRGRGAVGRPVASAPRALFAAVVVWAALGGRSLEGEASEVARLVKTGDLSRARERLPRLVGRDPSGMGSDELCRAAVESVAENTADAVVGPLVWGAVGGPAAVAAYRAANTLDAMVGHRSPRHERFGWAAAHLDDVVGWPGARLGALLAVVLAPLVDGDRRRAWSTLRRDGAAHPSPNAGRLEAAFAGALGVRLGGINRYPSHTEQRPTLGDGHPPTPADVHRATRLSRLIGVASAALATGTALCALRTPGAARARRMDWAVGGLRSLCEEKAPSAGWGRA